ncbi:fibronectin type-III domain-containing protein, partial [Nephila pilipes]
WPSSVGRRLTSRGPHAAHGLDRPAVLPGPPLNIQYHLVGNKDLEITWDSPQKNPKVVQWYKIFWRPVGSRVMYRNHTKQRSIALHDLEPGTTYEVVVKAGNHYGISLHSEPLTFTITDSENLKPTLAYFVDIFISSMVEDRFPISGLMLVGKAAVGEGVLEL